MMPEVDGLSLLRTMKNHPEWYRIPVVMLTTSEQPEDVRDRAEDRHDDLDGDGDTDVDEEGDGLALVAHHGGIEGAVAILVQVERVAA